MTRAKYGLNIHTLSPYEKLQLEKKGARWLVVVRYTRSILETQGDVLSWHKTHEAAARKAGSSSFLDLRDLAYDVDAY